MKRPVVRALHHRGVICDYRSPGSMRFGFAPLYNSYTDIWDAVEHLHDILDSAAFKAVQYRERNVVT